MPSQHLGEQIIISASDMPVVPSQTLLNQRGYAFRFPALGLPDESGEWVIIKAAIGARERAILLVQKDSVEPPMRYAYQGCGMIDIKYDGAIWIVPLVGAYKQGLEATELYLLKTRRLPLSTPYKHALTEVKDKDGLCHTVHPRGMKEFEVSAQTTSSDDKAFWSMTLAALSSPSSSSFSEGELNNKEQGSDDDSDGCGGDSGHVDPDFLNSLRVEAMIEKHPAIASRLEPVIEAGRGLYGMDYLRAVLPSMQKLAKEREKEVMDWEETPDKFFEKEWYSKTRAEAIQEARLMKTPPHPEGPAFSFRSHPVGEYARHEYAWLANGDEDAIPQPHQWKRVPPHAFKPGREYAMTNRARKQWGKGPLSEAQWAARVAEREAEEAAPSSSPTRRSRKGRKETKVNGEDEKSKEES